jgi:predicted aspartyl protease
MRIFTGSFDGTGSATLNIKVAGSGPGQEYSATIDTGFTGFVAMPIQEMITLGLKSEGAASVALGDGSVIYNLVAPASVTVGSQTVQGPILLDDTSSEILVGMAFLRAFRLALILTNTHVVLYDEAETLVAVANLMSTAPIGLPNTAPSSTDDTGRDSG